MTAPKTPNVLVPWPDTTAVPPPTDHPYASAVWLLGRHRQLAELVDRLSSPDAMPGLPAGSPGVADLDWDGPRLDLDLLAEALTVFDSNAAAWHDAGPAWPDTPTGAVAKGLACMSRTEQVRLRLLACFAPTGARFSAHMLTGLDDAGQQLVHDWLEAIRHA